MKQIIPLLLLFPSITLADIYVTWRYEDPVELYETVVIHVDYEGVPFEEVYVPATTTSHEYPTPKKGEYCFTLSAISTTGELTGKSNIRGCVDWDGKSPLPPLLQFGVR